MYCSGIPNKTNDLAENNLYAYKKGIKDLAVFTSNVIETKTANGEWTVFNLFPQRSAQSIDFAAIQPINQNHTTDNSGLGGALLLIYMAHLEYRKGRETKHTAVTEQVLAEMVAN